MCDQLSLDTLHALMTFFHASRRVCFHPVRWKRFWRFLILLCHAASRLHVWSFLSLKRALYSPWAELGLPFRRPRVFSHALPKKVFNLLCSYVLIKVSSTGLSMTLMACLSDRCPQLIYISLCVTWQSTISFMQLLNRILLIIPIDARDRSWTQYAQIRLIKQNTYFVSLSVP